MLTIKLSDIIASPVALSPRAAQKANDYVVTQLESKTAFNLSFKGIQECTSAFCNTFIGKLYMNFDPSLVDELMHISDVPDASLLGKKIHNAKILGMNENVRDAVHRGLKDLLLI